MKNIDLKYSREKINRAGKILIGDKPSEEDEIEALEILNNRRVVHNYPINTFQANLRRKVKTGKFSGKTIVAQRLKRTVSIINKLKRIPKMNLCRMQDIGGLRIILDNNESVYKMKESIIKSKFSHILKTENDYISEPKDSGYRSIHLVYQYKSQGELAQSYDGLQLEIQIRSKIQHIWATAVEIMGTVLSQSLKSSEGDKKRLDFFSIVSSAFAIEEKCNILEKHKKLKKQEIIEIIRNFVTELKVIEKLKAYSVVTDFVNKDKRGLAYYLLTLNPNEKGILVRGFKKDQLDLASEEYLRKEKENSELLDNQVVLVSVKSFKGLKESYPNYFLDSRLFIKKLEEIISFTSPE